MEEIRSLFERFESMPEEVNVNAVFGKPQVFEDRTVIPVAQFAYSFGAGFGGGSCPKCGAESEAGSEDAAYCDDISEDTDVIGGGGGGGGAHARPVAYIEITPEGTHVRPIIDEQKVALAGILLSVWAVGWVGIVLKAIFSPRG